MSSHQQAKVVYRGVLSEAPGSTSVGGGRGTTKDGGRDAWREANVREGERGERGWKRRKYEESDKHAAEIDASIIYSTFYLRKSKYFGVRSADQVDRWDHEW